MKLNIRYFEDTCVNLLGNSQTLLVKMHSYDMQINYKKTHLQSAIQEPGSSDSVQLDQLIEKFRQITEKVGAVNRMAVITEGLVNELTGWNEMLIHLVQSQLKDESLEREKNLYRAKNIMQPINAEYSERLSLHMQSLIQLFELAQQDKSLEFVPGLDAAKLFLKDLREYKKEQESRQAVINNEEEKLSVSAHALRQVNAFSRSSSSSSRSASSSAASVPRGISWQIGPSSP